MRGITVGLALVFATCGLGYLAFSTSRPAASPLRISGPFDPFETSAHAEDATEAEGPFYRVVARFTYEGKAVEFAPVVGCNIHGVPFSRRPSIRAGGRVPQVYGNRMDDGGAVAMIVPHLCDRRKETVQSMPERYLPFLIQFDDATKLDDGLGYASVDAYASPHSRMTYVSTSVEPADARAWSEFRRHGVPNVVTDRAWESRGDTEDRPFVQGCSMFVRTSLTPEESKGVTPSWIAAGKPAYWLPYGSAWDGLNPPDGRSFLQRLAEAPLVYSDTTLTAPHTRYELEFTQMDPRGHAVGRMELAGLPDYQGGNTNASMTGANTFYAAAVYPAVRHPVLREIPWQWDGLVKAVADTTSFVGTDIEIDDGAWKGFSHCWTLPYYNRDLGSLAHTLEAVEASPGAQIRIKATRGLVDGIPIWNPYEQMSGQPDVPSTLWYTILDHNSFLLQYHYIGIYNDGLN